MSIIHGRNPEGESVTGTNPVLIGAKDINGKSILLTTDADGKLQVATDLQVASVTATDVTIHDSTTPENKLKINTDGSVNTQLSGSKMKLYGATISDRPDATTVPIGATFTIVDASQEFNSWISDGTSWGEEI